jgi:hypothetical protein
MYIKKLKGVKSLQSGSTTFMIFNLFLLAFYFINSHLLRCEVIFLFLYFKSILKDLILFILN